jgi:fibronectin-binding autotransporter adhesin
MTTYTRSATSGVALTSTTAWATGVVPTSADEGTWNGTSAAASTHTSNWSVGKLSFGAGIGGNVALGTAGSTTAIVTLVGLSGEMVNLSGNTANRDVTFNGPVTFGSGGVGNVSIVGSPTSTGTLFFQLPITKSSGDVAYSGTGGIQFSANSDQTTPTWTGGSFTLNSGILFLGNGTGTDGDSGVLGTPNVQLNIGSGNPTIVSSNLTILSRGVNNPININGSFVFGGAAGAGVGRTRLDGPVTVGSGSYTITVPTTSGTGAFFSNATTPISGTGDLTKAGAGPLRLGTTGNANGTWTGKWLSSAGTTFVDNTNYFANAIFDSASIGVTWPASARIGGVTGSTNYAFPATLSFGPASVSPASVNATWTGGFITNNVTLTKFNPGTQILGGNSTGRTTAATTISAGAIQLNTATGLYAAAASNTTTVGSGGALWLNGVTTNAGSLANISGDGVALNGALRNVGGNSTHSATITLGASARIYNDIASTTLTLKNITWGANTLTLDTGATSTATILLDGTSSSSSTNAQMVVSGTGITKAPRATSIPTTNRVTVTVDTNARLQFTSTDAVVATVNTLKSNAGGNARIIIGT